MKNLLPALRGLMLSYSPISSVVATRIFPIIVPQGVGFPSIIQNLISEVDDYHTRGSSGLAFARVQIDCWARTDDAAVSLANDVHDLLSGFSGDIHFGSNSPQDVVVVRGIFAAQPHDDFDSIALLYTRRRDFQVWYSQLDAVPYVRLGTQPQV